MPTNIAGATGTDKFGGTDIAGHVIQVANFTTGVMATGTATIPQDNTIPQITEGTQFMSLAFTPKKANSKLKIDVVFVASNSTVASQIVALFKGSIADAIGVAESYIAGGGSRYTTSFTVYIDAVDTTLKTFTVRSGGHLAGTTTFNGYGGVQAYGGSLASSITITEIAQ